MTWERIEARTRGTSGRLTLAYWRRRLDDGTWLSVRRTSTTAAFDWGWVHHLRAGGRETAGCYCDEGAAMSSVTARSACSSARRRCTRRRELAEVLEKALKDRRSTSDT
jgi:hypothetical protein